MDDLIEALTLLKKYLKGYHVDYPTHCEHDVLQVAIDPDDVTPEDAAQLKELGFMLTEWNDELHPAAYSYRFGKC